MNNSALLSSQAAGSANSLFANLTNLLVIVFAISEAYISPVFMILVCINAFSCLSVFLFNREFQHNHSTNARYFYTLLALSDIVCVFIWHIPFFVGDGLYYLSGGRIFWYDLCVILRIKTQKFVLRLRIIITSLFRKNNNKIY